jgi:hypothetical protein
MKSLRKHLVIDVETDSEEEDLQHIITTEGDKLQIPCDEEQPVYEAGDNIHEEIVNYMEGENEKQDLSYKWYVVIHSRITSVGNIALLSKPIYVTYSNIDKIVIRRDIDCEYKVFRA